MKKLDKLIVKAFIGPFIATFFITLMVVVMVLAFPTSPQTFCNQRSDEQYNSPNMF